MAPSKATRRYSEAGSTGKGADRPRIARIAALIEQWFSRHSRDLPWRRDRNGYSALVSEAMLQQTQVARVLERYEAFMKSFPDLGSLAAADEQEVLAAWQGLGYYRRARHLHRAARMIVETHDGQIPRDAAALRGLPGVGRYTAGAIASIAFERREPIVDGNVARVLARVFGCELPIDDRASSARHWSLAGDLVNAAASPAALNEGMMELGAVICTPVSPKCASCPLRRMCIAKRLNRVDDIPPPRRAPMKKTVHHHAVVIQRTDGSVLLRRRPDDGLWAGMWQTPTIESDRPLGPAAVQRGVELPIGRCRRTGSFRHETTHRRIEFHVFRAVPAATIRGTWRDPTSPGGDLPMSNAQKRVLSAVLSSD